VFLEQSPCLVRHASLVAQESTKGKTKSNERRPLVHAGRMWTRELRESCERGLRRRHSHLVANFEARTHLSRQQRLIAEHAQGFAVQVSRVISHVIIKSGPLPAASPPWVIPGL
jgi:hypothetical protein